MNTDNNEMTSMEFENIPKKIEWRKDMPEPKAWTICDFVTTNDELKKLLPHLSEEEYGSLYESIEENGFDVSRGGKIVLWDISCEADSDKPDYKPEYLVVDGHNRWEICMELVNERAEMKYLPDDNCFTFIQFNSLDEVKLWIIRNQLERRNISVYGRFEVFYRNIDILRAQGRRNMVEGGKKGLTNLSNDNGPARSRVNARKELANLCGASEGTVQKFMAIADSEFQDLKEDLRYSIRSAYAAYRILKSRLGLDSEEDGKEVSGSKEGDDHTRAGKRNKSSDSQDLMMLMEEYKQKNKELY